MKAFSIGFDDATFDESQLRAHGGRAAGRRARRRDAAAKANLLDVVDGALDKLDEPLADPSFLPTFLLSRLAARHVKVVIGGDGGDELWAATRPTAPTVCEGARPGGSLRAKRVLPGRSTACRSTIGNQSLEWKLRRGSERGRDDSGTCAGCRASISGPEACAGRFRGDGNPPATRRPPAARDADWVADGSWRSTSRPTCPARC